MPPFNPPRGPEARDPALPIAAARFRWSRPGLFTVHEFAVLADGSRRRLNHDRGFDTSAHGAGGRIDPWTDLTLDRLESDVLTTVLPDDDGEDHPWAWLADRLGELGVEVAPDELERVPDKVEFSERLRDRVPRSR